MEIEVNGVRLWYDRVGRGFPLLMMHGGLGMDHSYFRPWFDRLADAFEVVYYDHRGNGRSGRSDPATTYTHEQLVRDADALRAALGFGKIALLGQSYGGILGLEYALRFQDRLQCLILVTTTPSHEFGKTADANARRLATPEMKDAVDRVLAGESTDEVQFKEDFLTILPLYYRRWKEEYRELARGILTDARTSSWFFKHAIPRYDVRPRLGEIRVPTLVVAGRHDWITDVEQNRIIAEGIPGAELAVFEESGHMPFEEEPEAFFDLVRGFLRRHCG